MMYLLLASFFYANVIYRLPIGSYGYVLVSDVVSWFVILAVFTLSMVNRTKSIGFGRLELCLVVLSLLMFLLLFQVFFEADRVFSELGRAAADTLRFFQYVFTYFAVRSYLRFSPHPIRYLAWTFILAVSVSIYGLLLDVVLKIPRSYAGITHDVLRPSEFSAFFTNNRACAAVYLLTAVAIGFGFLLMNGSLLRKSVVLFGTAALIIAIILSRSRSGIVGLSVSTVFFIIYYMRNCGRSLSSIVVFFTLVFIFCCALFFALTSRNVRDRLGIANLRDITRYEHSSSLTGSADRKIALMSVATRLKNWKESMKVIDEMSYHIFFGYGVNQQGAKIGMGGAHNNFLQVFVDLGLIGLGLFLLLLYEIARRLKVSPPELNASHPRYAMLIAMKYCFWGLLVTLVTQETFYMAPALGNFWGFYLVLLAIVSQLREELLPVSVHQEEINHAGSTAHSLCC